MRPVLDRALARQTILGLLLCTLAPFANAISPLVHRTVHLELQTRERSLLLPDGSYAGAAYQNALRRRALMVKAIAGASVSNASISWAELGPDNVGGRINSVWVDPKNASHILVASASGGLWQSIDGGLMLRTPRLIRRRVSQRKSTR